MNVRTALISSALLLAVLGWACESQAPTAPTSLGPAAVGVSSGSVASGTSASGALGVKPGGGRGKNAVVFDVDALQHGCPVKTNALISDVPGQTAEKGGLQIRWEAGEVSVTVSGVVLTGPAFLNAGLVDNKGRIEAVALEMILDADGTRYSTGQIPIAPVTPSAGGFEIHVHADNITVSQRKRRSGGPVVATVGTMCFGDLVFTPQ